MNSPELSVTGGAFLMKTTGRGIAYLVLTVETVIEATEQDLQPLFQKQEATTTSRMVIAIILPVEVKSK
jgi:hypothetical protein